MGVSETLAMLAELIIYRNTRLFIVNSTNKFYKSIDL